MNEDLPNLFQITFIGEFIELSLNLTDQFSSETPEGYSSGTVLATMKGYLLEFDDEYYYLGDEPNAVARVVRKEHVLAIEIVDQGKQFEKILDDMPIPKNESENN